MLPFSIIYVWTRLCSECGLPICRSHHALQSHQAIVPAAENIEMERRSGEIKQRDSEGSGNRARATKENEARRGELAGYRG